jgi:hypothetical protein
MGSRSGARQGMIGGDAPRRRRDDEAKEAARDGGVPAGEAASAVSGGLGVLRPETEARGWRESSADGDGILF